MQHQATILSALLIKPAIARAFYAALYAGNSKMNELLILFPTDEENNKPTKILNTQLEKIKSYDSGFYFYFDVLPYENFHDALKEIFKINTCFLVLGEPTEDARDYMARDERLPRRKKKGNLITIQDRDSSELVLDLDDHFLEDFDPLDPAPAIKKWLAEKKINCDVSWQITSGQKLDSVDIEGDLIIPQARIRLYFSASKDHPLVERKAWSQSTDIGADGSVYTCSQPIYTAPPIIEGGVDPIPQRYGFIKGARRTFILPLEVRKADYQKQNASFNRGCDYDFYDPSIPEEVLSGKVYRRYFMPLAFHYANKLKMDKEAVFAIIAAKSAQVKSREFDDENTWQYINDAFSIIKEEIEEEEELFEADNVATAEDLNEQNEFDLAPIPEFPNDLLENWPAPWPMLWNNFKRIPRVTEPALLIPTIFALMGFFLRAQYVTAFNRRPNMFFLNLTPSTGNKDVNSKNVIRDLAAVFKKRLGTGSRSVFQGIINTSSSITADTTFLESFDENDEFFWINTEATRIFQQIKNSTGNSNVAALSDKLIEVVDGHEISGKAKVKNNVKTIENPNCQVVFYAQPETIERYIDVEMVDSGLFGRALLAIVPHLEFDIENYEMFMDREHELADVEDEFFDFFHEVDFGLNGIGDIKTVLKPDDESRKILNDWARENVAPLMADDEGLQKVLSRIGNSGEQLYCIALGVCRKYDTFLGNKERKTIDIRPLLPILQYWVETKVYAIKNYINAELDPLAEAVLDILKNIITGKYKMMATFDAKAIKEHHVVPLSVFYRVLKSNTKLIKKLSADGDKKNAMVRVDTIIKMFLNNGILVKRFVKIGTSARDCIGLSK